MKTFLFDDLLNSLASGILSANRFLAGAQQDLSHLFHPSGTIDGALEPDVHRLVLPSHHVQAGEDPEQVHEIPTATLVPHQSTVLDTLSINFHCLIQGLEDAGGDKPKQVALILGSSLPNQHSGLATMSLTFKAGDPPEGMARINDQLLKKF